MAERKEYELSAEDMKELLDAMKPVPLIMLQMGMPSSRQQNANAAWGRLGKRMGFKGDTARPIPGRSSNFFTAEIADG